MKKLLVVFVIASIGSVGFSQDAFFSHFNYSSALTSPSQMGVSEDINFTLIHRSQWSSIVKPFTTSQFEASYPIRKANSNKKLAIVGLSFVNDRLGEGGYMTTNQFALTALYNLELSGNHSFAMGGKIGYFNGATDLDGVTTGSQFTGGSFSNTASLGEAIDNPVVSGLEISPSVTWYMNDEFGRNKHYFGVSAFNVNQPNSGKVVTGFKQPMRISLTGGTNFGFGQFGIAPKGLFMLQGNQNHIVVGTDFMYYLSDDSEKYMAIALGGYYRMNDAGIVKLKFLSNFIDGGIGYDINTSSLTDGLGTGTGSFEIFLNYRIKQKSKVKVFEYTIEVYDSTTMELTPATVRYKSTDTDEEGTLLNNQSKGISNLNQKEEYEITVTKDGYDPKTFTVNQGNGDDLSSKLYLTPTIRTFDLELDVLDKETGEPVPVNITLIDPITGKETDLGTADKLTTKLESGKKHTISVNADGYDNSIMELRYDKFGTLSKSIYVSKTKPKLVATALHLTVLDESNKQPIKTMIMAVNVTNAEDPQSSLIALNDFPPAMYPLEVGNRYEILVTREGYFNKTIKIEALKVEDVDRVIQLKPIKVGESVIVEDLLFKTGKTELDERSYRILNQLVDFLNQNPTIRIELQGHTDSDGSEASNQALSEGRAKSAVNYLQNKGVAATRLESKGFGEKTPIAGNNTSEGKAKNRRVELQIIGK